jgi:acetolactate synthase regulatory subunit
MNITSVHVRMKFIEGALSRLLGLAARRGFGIAGVEARRSHCGRRYEVALELIGDRSVDNLGRQFAKLYEVESVRVLPAADTLPFRSHIHAAPEAIQAAG